MFVSDSFPAFHLDVGDIVSLVKFFFSILINKNLLMCNIYPVYMEYIFSALLYLPLHINNVTVSELL